MPYSGSWGSYIHIPKTGGMWVQKVLSGIEPGKKNGAPHGLPLDWERTPIFCTTRHPVEWLASVWAHRVRHKWDDYNGEVPWKYLCTLLRSYRSDQFPEFIESVTTHLPGVIGWFWGAHISPVVKVIRLEDMPEYLTSIGGNPDVIPPQNVGFNAPDLTEEIYAKVWAAEELTYKRYGYRITR